MRSRYWWRLCFLYNLFYHEIRPRLQNGCRDTLCNKYSAKCCLCILHNCIYFYGITQKQMTYISHIPLKQHASASIMSILLWAVPVAEVLFCCCWPVSHFHPEAVLYKCLEGTMDLCAPPGHFGITEKGRRRLCGPFCNTDSAGAH